MRVPGRSLVAAACAVGLLVYPAVAAADHATRPHTPNLHAQGHSPFVASLLNGPTTDVNTDAAFWGDRAYNGNWDGFRIIDISESDNPTQIGRAFCNGDQGDVVVWGDIVVRSWNSPAPGTTTCDDELVPAGFEGLHVFDVSDVANPELIASVDLVCGSHTASAVPDPANDRLLVYSSSSNEPCPWFDIVEVPLDDPADAGLLRTEPSEHTCHDIGVILGSVMRAACAGGTGFRVFSLGGADGGSLSDPELLYHVDVPGVTIGHSATFSWDGEVIIFGHEPSGGVGPECEATDDVVKKSAFFYDADTGAFLGRWTLPRPQLSTENCTIHNYNVVPLRSGRRVLTLGNYQAGTWVVDFTDPANAVTLGWSDPPPLVPFDIGGAWSSYWYNGRIYESEITKGLNVFRFSDAATAGAIRLGHLNPQTQEFSLR
jgi:LVIVD repeat